MLFPWIQSIWPGKVFFNQMLWRNFQRLNRAIANFDVNIVQLICCITYSEQCLFPPSCNSSVSNSWLQIEIDFFGEFCSFELIVFLWIRHTTILFAKSLNMHFFYTTCIHESFSLVIVCPQFNFFLPSLYESSQQGDFFTLVIKFLGFHRYSKVQ